MPERNPLQAAQDTVTLALPKDFNGTVTLQLSGGAAPVGANVVLELSADDGVSWEIATMNKADKTTVAALTVAGSSGWAEAPGYTHARARLTAITSGTQGVRLTWRKG